MAKSRVVIQINTDLSVATLQNILSDSASRPHPFAQKINNFFRGLNAGARTALVLSGAADSGSVDSVAASKAGTFSAAATALDTVTINGVVLTAVANVATPANNEFRVGTSAATAASNLSAAINASTSDNLSGVVQASVSGAVVTVSCLIQGVIGNNIAISESSSTFSFAGGATALSGGLGKLPVPVSFSFGKS